MIKIEGFSWGVRNCIFSSPVLCYNLVGAFTEKCMEK